MTLALRYAVRSDVGLLREGNEDSAYAGPAPAGRRRRHGRPRRRRGRQRRGHLALAGLDDDVPGSDLLDALADAVSRREPHAARHGRRRPLARGHGHHAHRHAVVRRPGGARATSATPAPTCCATASSTRSPTTTRWCRRWSTRAGSARTRWPPTRSARCCCGRWTAGPTSSRTCRCARPSSGDRYLLCSDGLSGVVSEETLHKTLATVATRRGRAAAGRAGHPGRRPGQHHLHRRRRGGQRHRGPAAQRRLGDGRRRLQRQRRPAISAPTARPGAPTCSPAPPRRPRWRSPTTTRRRGGAGDEPEDELPPPAAQAAAGQVALVILLMLVVGGGLRGLAVHPDPVLRGLGRRQGRHLPRHQPERRRDQPVQRGQRTGIPVAGLPAAMAADVRATITVDHGLAGAQSIVTNSGRTTCACHDRRRWPCSKWEATPREDGQEEGQGQDRHHARQAAEARHPGGLPGPAQHRQRRPEELLERGRHHQVSRSTPTHGAAQASQPRRRADAARAGAGPNC